MDIRECVETIGVPCWGSPTITNKPITIPKIPEQLIKDVREMLEPILSSKLTDSNIEDIIQAVCVQLAITEIGVCDG